VPRANGKRRRYTDDFRASVVLMLEAAGYPDRKGALMAVSRKSKVPHPTLSRWYRKIQNPPPNDLVQHKKIDFEQAIEEEMTAILKAMQEARPDAYYTHLATAFGIMFDKRQLLTGGSTENVNQQTVTYIKENRPHGD
jgi:transposase-like protein